MSFLNTHLKKKDKTQSIFTKNLLVFNFGAYFNRIVLNLFSKIDCYFLGNVNSEYIQVHTYVRYTIL